MKLVHPYFPYFLVFYHLCFAIIGWQYIGKYHGDSEAYWFVDQSVSGLSWFDFFQPGTDLVQLITFPMVKYFHLPIWFGCLLFSSISSVAFVWLWQILKKCCDNQPYLLYLSMLLLLLPNLHFWTALIGKEALLIVLVVYLLRLFSQCQFFSWKVFAVILIVGLIRPHVAIIIVAAYVLAIFWKGKLTQRQKIMVAIVGVALFLISGIIFNEITPYRYPNIFEKIAGIYKTHIKVLKTSASYVPMEEYHFPYKLFTFYFRPFFWEKNGWKYLVSGIENLIILLTLLFAIFSYFKKKPIIKFQFTPLFCVILLLIYGTVFSYAYANFGLILRTKVLVMPAFYLLIIFLFTKNKAETTP